MKINIKWTIAAIFSLVLIILVIPKLELLQGKPEGPAANPAQAAAMSVEAAVIRPQVLDDKVIASGTVLANEEVELRSEISGKITRILFREGKRVRKGDLLLKINDSELQAQLRKSDYQIKLAEEKERRQRKQLELEAISQEAYDTALNELNVLKSEAELIRARIEKTEIRAPFDGYIGLKFVSEGSYISPSSEIATLINRNPVKIDFSVPEKYADEVHIGDKIVFTAQSSDSEYEGKIYAIEPRIDPATRSLRMRGIYENRSGEILPGSFVEVRLVLHSIQNALLIPTEALIPDLSGQKVFLLENGKAALHSVRIGIRTNSSIQITDGIQPGDTLITTGIQQLRPGMPVQISNLD